VCIKEVGAGLRGGKIENSMPPGAAGRGEGRPTRDGRARVCKDKQRGSARELSCAGNALPRGWHSGMGVCKDTQAGWFLAGDCGG
jgi:hypothetical protein